MADKSIRGSAEDQRQRLNRICQENPEYLQARVYQVFEQWEEEQGDGTPTPIPHGKFRQWLHGKFRQWWLAPVLSFDLRLSEVDRRLLRKMGIRA